MSDIKIQRTPFDRGQTAVTKEPTRTADDNIEQLATSRVGGGTPAVEPDLSGSDYYAAAADPTLVGRDQWSSPTSGVGGVLEVLEGSAQLSGAAAVVWDLGVPADRGKPATGEILPSMTLPGFNADLGYTMLSVQPPSWACSTPTQPPLVYCTQYLCTGAQGKVVDEPAECYAMGQLVKRMQPAKTATASCKPNMWNAPWGERPPCCLVEIENDKEVKKSPKFKTATPLGDCPWQVFCSIASEGGCYIDPGLWPYCSQCGGKADITGVQPVPVAQCPACCCRTPFYSCIASEATLYRPGFAYAEWLVDATKVQSTAEAAKYLERLLNHSVGPVPVWMVDTCNGPSFHKRLCGNVCPPVGVAVTDPVEAGLTWGVCPAPP